MKAGVVKGVYYLLLASHVMWLILLIFVSIYALVFAVFTFLVWPLGQIAGVAGAVFLMDHDKSMGAIMLLIGMIGANLSSIYFVLDALR